MKRLLVTGAGGFIGRQLLEPAREAGYEVHGIRSSQAPSGREDGVTWHQADLRKRSAVDALIEQVRPTHMLHGAWVTEHGAYWTSPDNLDWLAAGAYLVRVFAAAGGRRFVSVGTCAEYAWESEDPLIEGTSLEQPDTFYGRIKLAHHHMVMAAADRFGFSAATGRIFFLFGPGETPSRVVAHACRALAAGEVATFSSGTQQRDFLHVADAGRGLAALLDSSLTGAVNVSSGQAYGLREVVETIGEIAGRPDLLRFDSKLDRAGDPALILGDNSKLVSAGWEPRFTLRDGLADAYHYWQGELRKG